MRAIRAEMRGIAQVELTVAQFRVLSRLDHARHSNKQLADWMGIAPASMCGTIVVLVKRGYVSGERGVEDRREVTLVLTPKGRRKHESIKDATKRMLEKKLEPL